MTIKTIFIKIQSFQIVGRVNQGLHQDFLQQCLLEYALSQDLSPLPKVTQLQKCKQMPHRHILKSFEKSEKKKLLKRNLKSLRPINGRNSNNRSCKQRKRKSRLKTKSRNKGGCRSKSGALTTENPCPRNHQRLLKRINNCSKRC